MGPEALGGFLAGATVSGVLMGMFQNNAGGAWDNAKKSFEKGVEINGEVYYKKSEPHKASVTGDTVGDPFKDTSGPSMNILIKLMSIVSLVIAPTLAQVHGTKSHHTATVVSEVKKAALQESPLLAALKADGLVSATDNVTVEVKNGKLTINGVAQSDDVNARYSQLMAVPAGAATVKEVQIIQTTEKR
jgi:K(+)-stimulated pyrophosphate-energized sodium pump